MKLIGEVWRHLVRECGDTQDCRRRVRRRTSGLVPAWMLGLAVILTGCGPGAVARRAEEIRAHNARNDRISGALAAHVVRKQWLVRDGVWFGKNADGTMVRMDSPTITSAPLKQGRPYCCKWLGEITVAGRPECTAAGDGTVRPFSLTYTVLVRDSDRVEIVGTSGPPVTPPDQEDITKQPPNL